MGMKAWIIPYDQSLIYDWQYFFSFHCLLTLSLLIILITQLLTGYAVLFLITSMKRKFFKKLLLFFFTSTCLLTWDIFKRVIGVIMYSHCSLRWVSLIFKDFFSLLKVRTMLQYNLEDYILVFWESGFTLLRGEDFWKPFWWKLGFTMIKVFSSVTFFENLNSTLFLPWGYPLEKFLYICTENMHPNVHFSIISDNKNYKYLKYFVNGRTDKLHIFIYGMNYSYIHHHVWI